MGIEKEVEQNKTPNTKGKEVEVAEQQQNSLGSRKASTKSNRNIGECGDFSIVTQNAFGILAGGNGDKQPPDKGDTKTRVKRHKAEGIIPKIAKNWGMVHNYEQASNGRIWIMFDTNIWQVEALHTDAQFIHCNITSTNVKCAMTVVYGFNSIELRKGMWQKLRRVAQSVKQAWLIWGDFNAILSVQDRISRHEVTMAEIQDFGGFCFNTKVTEISWSGNYFTWANGQMGGDRVTSRIDRAMGNGDWMMKYGHITVEVGDPFISDHSPLTIKFQRLNNDIKVPFKFMNVWADHDEFQNIVTIRWHGIKHECKLVNVWYRLKDMKTDFKELNNKNFREVSERTCRKNIKTLTAIDGTVLTDLKGIKKEIVEFYKSLMGTSAKQLPAVNMSIMKNGHVLNQHQITELVKSITREEIDNSLNAIGNDKAPGIDGYNAVFFKKAWGIMKNDVYEAVMDFFQTSHMPKIINCTTVTLLPKVTNPITVKDFRPISCCSVLYKIIAKILATRLQVVMSDIIDGAQAGIIPGRKGAENIILAHELIRAYSRKHVSPRCMIKVDL
ncbi:PREDICTED: uncharacterized protein LOC109225918 [Nicotiana attenuata]|uniref:uncharacterized protein LOC109225918 n=1 Tax=Nicotiana attenuata TaxID=49451 RepID=UPI0009049F50|nr:PREDICTED: uncharacterized protein LOC109225918 [Nicotiana attenuata]